MSNSSSPASYVDQVPSPQRSNMMRLRFVALSDQPPPILSQHELLHVFIHARPGARVSFRDAFVCGVGVQPER